MTDASVEAAPAPIPRKRAIFIDVRRGTLLRLSRALKPYRVRPVLWMGYAEALAKVSARWPTCEIYDYWRFNRGAAFLMPPVGAAPPAKVLNSETFRRLKDQTIKMMDRHDTAGQFRYPDREALFYALFYHFYGKIKALKPHLAISAHSPHLPAPMVVYGVCRILKVKTVHLREVPLTDLTYLATDFEDGFLETVSDQGYKEGPVSDLTAYIERFSERDYDAIEPSYMKVQKANDAAIDDVRYEHRFGSYANAASATDLRAPPLRKTAYSITSADFLEDRPSVRFKIEPDQSLNEAAEAYKNELLALARFEYDQVAERPDLTRPFVYFPLHYEPEKTSNPDGGAWYNVYDAIAALRATVPMDVPIYVKEHYSQLSPSMSGARGRSAYFYRAVQSLPNVILIDMDTPQLDLMIKAIFTASQTGTACLEAACLGRKAVLLGDLWFSRCPNIWRFADLPPYEDLLAAPIRDAATVEAVLSDWLKRHTVNGYVTGSFIRMHARRKLPRGTFPIENTCTEIAQSLHKAGWI